MHDSAPASQTSFKETAGDWFAGGLYHLGLWHPYFRLKGAPTAGAPAAILTFHRLIDDDTVYLPKGIVVHTHIRIFEETIAAVSRHYNMVSLDRIIEAFEGGEPLPRDSVAVTFDDGYEDTFRLGLRVLRRYGVPATVFLATGFIDTAQRMWPDRIEQALLNTKRDLVHLDQLGVASSTPALPIRTRAEKTFANTELARLFKHLDAASLAAALERLEASLGTNGTAGSRVMLDWNEVRGLHEGGVAIGSHGVTHQIMTKLEFSVARDELAQSKATIEENLGQPVRHFAFPNGRAQDFSPELGAACRELGYESVCTALWGVVDPAADDPYFLRRVALARNLPRFLLSLELSFRRWRQSRNNSMGRNAQA